MVRPSAENGLRAISQVMADRAISVPRDKVGPSFGKLDDETMQAVNMAGLVPATHVFAA
jgi:mRNA interferase MazF